MLFFLIHLVELIRALVCILDSELSFGAFFGAISEAECDSNIIHYIARVSE
jgi:hypothetical protein